MNALKAFAVLHFMIRCKIMLWGYLPFAKLQGISIHFVNNWLWPLVPLYIFGASTNTASHEAANQSPKKSIVMKKVVTILTVAIMLCSVFAFATDSDNVNARVKTAFVNDFSTAGSVTWQKISDFNFASFTINNVEFNAAYNEEGELIGTSRTMEAAQLPMGLSLTIAKKYVGYIVGNKVLELNFDGETRYYVTVSNDKQAMKLKCSPSGGIHVERKIKKI